MGEKHTVSVRDTDISFSCGGDEAVLHAMIHAGKGPIRHGCCGGGCGVCKARIVSGGFAAFKPMSAAHVSEADKKQGIALLCCVQPRSDMVIAPV
jgi:ferredoxin